MLSQFQHRLTRDVAFQGFVAGKMLIRCQGQSLRFASGQTSVSIHTLAIYIHEQINGTFPNIFHQLLQRVDLLEYPNDGSRTIVSLDDARVIVEDIGAHADELEAFVAEDHLLDKSIGFPEPTQEHASQEPRLRHPRYALHGFKGRLGGGSLSAEACVEDLPTQEILARIRRDAIGLWYKKVGTGYVVRSLSGMYRLKASLIDHLPVDGHFNAWYNTHRSEGWKPCAGPCAGHKDVHWYEVATEDPPFISKQFQQKAFKGCVGYCRTARNQQEKE